MGSVALVNDGELIHEVTDAETSQHSEQLIPKIEHLLDGAKVAKSSIDLIAVDQGPGSFTGLRVGMAAAQGLSMGLDRPMISISSLHAMAMAAASYHSAPAYLLPVLNAYKGEVYASLYQLTELPTPLALKLGPMHKTARELCEQIATLALPNPVYMFGNGVEPYLTSFRALSQLEIANDHDLLQPKASILARLAVQHIDQLGSSNEVTYVRPSDAELGHTRANFRAGP